MSHYFINHTTNPIGLFQAEDYKRVSDFYESQPDTAPTALHHLPSLAATLNLAGLMIKDESTRMGMPAFKIAGVWYAVKQLLHEGTLKPGMTVVTATSGNHGRAVARAARLCQLQARIYVPSDALPARINAIAGEGAEVKVGAGNYNDAVRQAADEAERNGWFVVSDTSYAGYEEVPRLIMSGYTRLIEEAASQWEAPPNVVLVQGGVGGLACAVSSWFAWHYPLRRPYLICCEPTHAACLLESTRAGKPVVVKGSLETKMEGLRCSEVSPLAWQVVAATFDAFVAIDDDRSLRTMRLLANPNAGDPPVLAGASGACGLATLIAVLSDEELRPVREQSGLNENSVVLVINSEGATDAELYALALAGGT